MEPTESSTYAEQIQAYIRTWDMRGRPRDMLYQKDELSRAIEWARTGVPTPAEMDFVVASIAAEERRAAALFWGFITYELRGRTRSAEGFASLILQDKIDYGTESFRQAMIIIHKIAGYVLGWLNVLSLYRRFETGDLHFERTTIDLDEVIDNVISRMEEKRQLSENLSIVKSVELGLPTIYGNAHYLGQMLEALLHEWSWGGAVTIKASYSDPRLTFLGLDYVQVDVIGMNKERFTGYTLGKDRLTRSAETDFSREPVVWPDPRMAVVQHIVERHGGSLRIDAITPESSVLRFTLPTEPSPDETMVLSRRDL